MKENYGWICGAKNVIASSNFCAGHKPALLICSEVALIEITRLVVFHAKVLRDKDF